MRSLHEVNWDGDMLDLTKHGIQVAASMNLRIIWNHKGMRRLVPDDIIEAELRLLQEYMVRRRQYDTLPERVGQVVWAQTIPVPEAAPRDPDQIDIKS